MVYRTNRKYLINSLSLPVILQFCGMTVKLKVVMMVFACCSYQSQAEDLNALKVKEYRLENGLTVWLNEDHSQPKVFGAVVVKAGAKDCPDTGIAHYSCQSRHAVRGHCHEI